MNKLKKRIAILGATSHIAKGLIYGFSQSDTHELFLFGRSIERIKDFLALIKCQDIVAIKEFDSFNSNKYDVIINCVGIGDPGKLRGIEESIFRLTETYDNLILDYLKANPETLYINFSSGAVYGTDFTKPADPLTQYILNVNDIYPSDYYGITKLYIEAKHRSLKSLNIGDIRVFNYFSRFIDIQAKFLINDILNCIKQKMVFETGSENITRDYVHPDDLFALIECCISRYTLNDVFDVYSLRPITKFEMLEFFSSKYGLKYSIKSSSQNVSPTGIKEHYHSTNRKAQQIGYSPRYTSLECIMQESKYLIVL